MYKKKVGQSTPTLWYKTNTAIFLTLWLYLSMFVCLFYTKIDPLVYKKKNKEKQFMNKKNDDDDSDNDDADDRQTMFLSLTVYQLTHNPKLSKVHLRHHVLLGRYYVLVTKLRVSFPIRQTLAYTTNAMRCWSQKVTILSP